VDVYACLGKLEEISDKLGLEVCTEDRIPFLGDIAIQALFRVSQQSINNKLGSYYPVISQVSKRNALDGH
jgi:hypothetical protein